MYIVLLEETPPRVELADQVEVPDDVWALRPHHVGDARVIGADGRHGAPERRDERAETLLVPVHGVADPLDPQKMHGADQEVVVRASGYRGQVVLFHADGDAEG